MILYNDMILKKVYTDLSKRDGAQWRAFPSLPWETPLVKIAYVGKLLDLRQFLVLPQLLQQQRKNNCAKSDLITKMTLTKSCNNSKVTEFFTDFNKLRLVKFRYGCLVLGSSQFFLLP